MRKYIDNNDSSQTAWIAVLDVQDRNARNKSLFTELEIAEGERILAVVQAAYLRSKVYLNYRKTFIAVKVDKPTKPDRLGTAVEVLDRYADQHSIDLVRTTHNFVYRLAIK